MAEAATHPPRKPGLSGFVGCIDRFNSSGPSSQTFSVWDGDRKSHPSGGMCHYGSLCPRRRCQWLGQKGLCPELTPWPPSSAIVLCPDSQARPPFWMRSFSSKCSTPIRGLLRALNLKGVWVSIAFLSEVLLTCVQIDSPPSSDP